MSHVLEKNIGTSVGLSCFGVVLAAILIQGWFDLPYCPKCVFQRELFVVIGLFYFLMAFVKGWRALSLFMAFCLSGWGFSVAVNQSYAWMFRCMEIAQFYPEARLPLLDTALPLIATACFMGLAFLSIYLMVRLEWSFDGVIAPNSLSLRPASFMASLKNISLVTVFSFLGFQMESVLPLPPFVVWVGVVGVMWMSFGSLISLVFIAFSRRRVEWAYRWIISLLVGFLFMVLSIACGLDHRDFKSRDLLPYATDKGDCVSDSFKQVTDCGDGGICEKTIDGVSRDD